MKKTTKIVIPKASHAQVGAAKQLIRDIGARDGAVEAISRSVGALLGKTGKATPEVVDAVRRAVLAKYKGAAAVMHQYNGKWTVKFLVSEGSKAARKASSTAQKFYSRTVAPLLPAVTKRSGKKAKAAPKAKVSRAQGAINGMVVSLTKRIKVNKMNRAQVMEAVRTAIKLLGLK